MNHASPILVKVQTPEQMQGYTAAWRDLCDRCLDPNVFYEPAFALAAIAHLPECKATQFLTFWHPGRESTPGALIGVYPFTSPVLSFGALLLGWRHAHSVLGIPLLDREHGPAVVARLFEWLDTGWPGRGGLLLPLMPLESETARLHTALAAASGRRVVPFSAHQRPALRPGVDEVVPARLAKLRRNRRKLEQAGPVEFIQVSGGRELGPSLDRFLSLESAGWKGASQTALASHPETHAFFVDATRGLAQKNQCRVALLRAGETVVAAAVILGAARRVCVWKIAFDERFAKAAPGIQLDAELGLAHLADPSIALTDSCDAPSSGSALSALWSGTEPMADVFIPALGAAGRVGLACETIRRGYRRVPVEFGRVADGMALQVQAHARSFWRTTTRVPSQALHACRHYAQGLIPLARPASSPRVALQPVAACVLLVAMSALLLSPWPAAITLKHLAAAPSCRIAFALGAAPAMRGEPGYFSWHDRQNEGVACKTYARRRLTTRRYPG